MPYSYALTTAGGISAVVSVPFPYISKSHVHVLVDNVEVPQDDLTWTTESTITLPTIPTAGENIKVYRATPLTAPLVAFGSGALDAADLNLASKQALYLSQELKDGIENTEEVAASIIEYLDAVSDYYNQTVAKAAEADASADAAAASAALADASADAVAAALAALPAENWTSLASAATVDLSVVTTTLVTLSGSASITSFGTPVVGKRVWVRSSGSFTLVHSTSLLVPGNADFQVGSGDVFLVVCGPTASPTPWRVTQYQRSNGSPINIAAQLADNAATLLGTSTTTAVSPARALEADSVRTPNYLSGMLLSRTAATTISVSPGAAHNGTINATGSGGQFLANYSAFTKVLAATWAAGAGANGLDTGSPANNTWYHVWAIRNTTTGAIDFLFSTSPTSPTVPGGFALGRRLGAVLTDGSAQIVPFTQIGDDFLWTTPVVDVNAVNPGTSAVTRALTVPSGISVVALINVGAYGGTTGDVGIYVSPLSATDSTPQAGGTASLTNPATASGPGGPRWNYSYAEIPTDTARSVRSRMATSGASDRIGIITLGWRDERGK